VVSQVARASHVRPRGATPIRVSLVPAYAPCIPASSNRTHGEALAFASCAPPVQASNFLTVGSPDANGARANSIGFIELRVVPHFCCPPQDVVIKTSISDVRCRAGTAASVCTGANAAGGADYSGELQGNATIRITDHNNGPNMDEAATMIDIPFPMNMYCTNTSDTSIGGFCTVNTAPVAIVPETSEPPRAVVEFTQFQVFDGGADGSLSTQDSTLFAVQGVFIP
jgi:hypothetical protein